MSWLFLTHKMSWLFLTHKMSWLFLTHKMFLWEYLVSIISAWSMGYSFGNKGRDK